MIDFYTAATPNGWKVAIMLYELGVPFQPHLVDLPAGEQLQPRFLAINPNGKIPAIVDRGVEGRPIPVFESGAILLYLARQHERYGAQDEWSQKELMEWLFWQAANQGPMAGQLSHFVNYAPKGEDYAHQRYLNETKRTFQVLETRLNGRDYILGEYSIVDMMAFPWPFIARKLGIDLSDFPNVAAWRSRLKERPAVQAAVDLFKAEQFTGKTSAKANTTLFNQGRDALPKGAA